MKSAYELAMERMGVSDEPVLSDERKGELAKVEEKYKARIAEKEIFLKGKIKEAGGKRDFAAVRDLEKQLQLELSRLRDEMEEAKERIRKARD